MNREALTHALIAHPRLSLIGPHLSCLRSPLPPSLCVSRMSGVTEERPREVVGVRKREWKHLQEGDFKIPIETPRSKAFKAAAAQRAEAAAADSTKTVSASH
jgi:hypothetical protein